MKIFTAIFDLAVVPFRVAADTVMLLPDISCGRDAFERTRAQCEQVDQDISR